MQPRIAKTATGSAEQRLLAACSARTLRPEMVSVMQALGIYPSYQKIPACERSCGRIAALQSLDGVNDPSTFCALHCNPQSSPANPLPSGTKGIVVNDSQVDQLLAYMDLLVKWNKVYNLTAIRDLEGILSQHISDCLAILSTIIQLLDTSAQCPSCVEISDETNDSENQPAGSILDVGSGAGLPGVVIAVMCPQLQVVCIDTVEKKMAFVRQVAAELGLPKLTAVHGRIEKHSDCYDLVTSRAFSDLKHFVELAGHCVKPGGKLVAMKGPRAENEIADLAQSKALARAVTSAPQEPLASDLCASDGVLASWRLAPVVSLTVPRLDAARYLVILEKLVG